MMDNPGLIKPNPHRTHDDDEFRILVRPIPNPSTDVSKPIQWHHEILSEGNFFLIWTSIDEQKSAYIEPVFSEIENTESKFFDSFHTQYDVKLPRVTLRVSHAQQQQRPSIAFTSTPDNIVICPWYAILFRVPSGLIGQRRLINELIQNHAVPTLRNILFSHTQSHDPFSPSLDNTPTNYFRPLDHRIMDVDVQKALYLYELPDVPLDDVVYDDGHFRFPVDEARTWYENDDETNQNHYFSKNVAGQFSSIATLSGYF